jgi:hypothetical protein
MSAMTISTSSSAVYRLHPVRAGASGGEGLTGSDAPRYQGLIEQGGVVQRAVVVELDGDQPFRLMGP